MNEQTAFERIIKRIFVRGFNDAADYYGKDMPENPYKRPQYQNEWKRGYHIGTAMITNSLERFKWLERHKL
jgi:hypothetical protein